MAAYAYKALDAKGKMTKGIVEGDSERQVRSLLRAQQLKPVEVSSAAGARASTSDNKTDKQGGGLFKTRISSADLSMLTRQLATLIQSNMPLDEALTASAQQARKPKIKSLILQVRARVLEGHSLAYALGDFPQVFNSMYCAMVKAGEHAGFLGLVLEQLADYTENSQYTQQKLKMAMIYPIILMLVAVGVVSLLMIFVVPELVGLFQQSRTELPAITVVLISLSDFINSSGHWLLIAIIAFIVAIKQLLKKPSRRYLWHKLQLKLPFIGDFFTAADSARFASTLSILASSGVPLLEALRIAGAVLNNLQLRAASEQVAVAVQEGMSLNKALNQAGVFPPMMVHMVASGEASGELEGMLARCAKNQERELEMTLGSVMAVMEPMMIVLMAAVVGLIVVAILLPIVQMNNLVA
ncbi:type II secretion system inner membrane protein GspF [Dasania marina]|uniref:type II secretion system inner membrane protein GspF n=1 Tax=Dasania marina TaxID=471499 RepID=UPI000366C973|nr:type II secretion system inner membrane protein GspF [Dasania marina]